MHSRPAAVLTILIFAFFLNGARSGLSFNAVGRLSCCCFLLPAPSMLLLLMLGGCRALDNRTRALMSICRNDLLGCGAGWQLVLLLAIIARNVS
jgi:hypothetical protein